MLDSAWLLFLLRLLLKILGFPAEIVPTSVASPLGDSAYSVHETATLLVVLPTSARTTSAQLSLFGVPMGKVTWSTSPELLYARSMVTVSVVVERVLNCGNALWRGARDGSRTMLGMGIALVRATIGRMATKDFIVNKVLEDEFTEYFVSGGLLINRGCDLGSDSME